MSRGSPPCLGVCSGYDHDRRSARQSFRNSRGGSSGSASESPELKLRASGAPPNPSRTPQRSSNFASLGSPPSEPGFDRGYAIAMKAPQGLRVFRGGSVPNPAAASSRTSVSKRSRQRRSRKPDSGPRFTRTAGEHADVIGYARLVEAVRRATRLDL